jgi:cytoskeletal protein CcmA (bactofilin family)
MELEPSTILGEDIDFRGRLKFRNDLKILGKFKGIIETNGNLIIGETAEVKADISSGSVVVGGILKGNISAEKHVEIKSKGNIRGDIKTPDLQIASGAKFTGSCQME